MINAIKLMPDYHCAPLWHASVTQTGCIDPAELPLSGGLREALWNWAKLYDRTLNQEYPPDSGFASDADERAFDREGRRLWRALREELPSVRVSYFSVLDRKLYE